MPHIKNIHEIIEHTDPVDIIGRRIPLHRSGNNHAGRCPFHSGGQERTPSLHVNYKKGWYCHGPCKRGGSALDFLMEFEGLDFPEAVELLASESGVRIQYDNTSTDEDKNRLHRRDLYAVIEAAVSIYQRCLSENQDAMQYADLRGLTEDVRQRWQIGYARGSTVKEAGDEETLLAAGLLKRSKKNGDLYDPLAGRLVVPLHDTAGRPIAFTGRALPHNNSSAKYINTEDTRIYRKREHLFAYHAAVRTIRSYPNDRKPSPLILEGQLNTIACHEQGIPAVAPGGSVLTERQALLIQRISESARLAYDWDTAGVAATVAAAKRLRAIGQNVSVATLDIPNKRPDEEPPDPDEYAAAGHKISFGETDLVTWAVDHLLTKNPETPEWARQITEHILPLIRSHIDSVVREVEIHTLSSLTGITVETLNSGKVEQTKDNTSGQRKSQPSIDTKLTVARIMCAIALQMSIEQDALHWQLYLRPLELPVSLLSTLSDIGRVRTVAATYGIPVTTAIQRLLQAGTLRHAHYLQYWATVELPGPADITGFCRVQDRVIAEEDTKRHKQKELI